MRRGYNTSMLGFHLYFSNNAMEQTIQKTEARSLLAVRGGPTRVRLGLPPRVVKFANETPAANAVNDR